jgi:flagellin-like protein
MNSGDSRDGIGCGSRLLNHRAVNEVVAALLVIAVTVTAAILLYVFAVGTVANTAGGGQQVAQQLILEGYDWGGGSNQFSGSFKNVGNTPIVLDSADVFVNGIRGTLTVAIATLGPQQSTTFTVDISSGTFVRGVSYTLKIVTASGALASYSVVCGSSS